MENQSKFFKIEAGIGEKEGLDELKRLQDYNKDKRLRNEERLKKKREKKGKSGFMKNKPPVILSESEVLVQGKEYLRKHKRGEELSVRERKILGRYIEKRKEELSREIEVIDGDIESANEEVKERVRRNKACYFGVKGYGWLGDHGVWEPNPGQKDIIGAINRNAARIYGMVGGNQQGKTLLQGMLVLALMKGYWPWEDVKKVGRHLWVSHGWKHPINIRGVGGGWEEHIQKNLIEQILEDIWPQSWGLRKKKNNMGVEYMWTDEETGSQLTFMSNNQSRKAFAGWKGHATLFDEPFPSEIWAEVVRGLVAKGGIAFIGASLVEEDQSWIEDEIFDKGMEGLSVYKHTGKMLDNIGYGLKKENVDQFLKMIGEEEAKTRIHGESAGQRAKILKLTEQHFLNKTVADIPMDYIVDISVDYHPNKPQYIGFLATGPYNVKYYCHEIVSDYGESAGYKWIGSKIVWAIKRYQLRLGRIIIDPLSKGSRNALEDDNETVYSKLSDYLAGYGYYLETATKNKDDSIITINSMLNPMEGNPILYIYDLPIAKKQLKKWRYDEFGKPSKKDDDSCENLYRLVDLGTEYEPPQPDYGDFEEVVDKSTANSKTGY